MRAGRSGTHRKDDVHLLALASLFLPVLDDGEVGLGSCALQALVEYDLGDALERDEVLVRVDGEREQGEVALVRELDAERGEKRDGLCGNAGESARTRRRGEREHAPVVRVETDKRTSTGIAAPQ